MNNSTLREALEAAGLEPRAGYVSVRLETLVGNNATLSIGAQVTLDIADPIRLDVGAAELRVEGDYCPDRNVIRVAKASSWESEDVALVIEHFDGSESIIEEPGDAGYISNAGVVYSDIFATMLDAGVELRTGVIHDVQILIPTSAGFAVGKAIDAGLTGLLHAAFAGAQPEPGQIGSVEILSISADPVLDLTGLWVGHAVAVFHPAN